MNIPSDIKYALRMIRKDLGTSSLIVLILSLGIGVSVLMFSIVNGILWQKPLEQKKTELLHFRWNTPVNSKNITQHINASDYQYFADHNQTMESLSAYTLGDLVIYNPNGKLSATAWKGVTASANYLQMFDVEPILGRVFNQNDLDEGRKNVVVISYHIWQYLYDKSDDVVGQQLYIYREPYTIIGVMPEGFRFPWKHHLWIPTDWELNGSVAREDLSRVLAMGFAKKSFSEKERQLEFDTFAKQLMTNHPETNGHYKSVKIQPINHYFMADMSSNLLYVMLFCALGVLFVSCANSSNLIIGKIYQRSHEFALRSAFGAKRIRIIFQLTIFSLALSIVGAFSGLVLSTWACRWITPQFSWSGFPNWWKLEIDARAMFFAMGLAVVASILTSLIPAIKASAKNNASIINDSTRTFSSSKMGRISKFLVMAQISLSLVLLIVAFTVTLFSSKMVNRKPVFDTDSVLTTTFRVQAVEGFETDDSVLNLYDDLRDRMLVVPGVENVGYINAINGGTRASRKRFEIEGVVYEKPDQHPISQFADASINFFQTMGVQPLSGRGFSDLDIYGSEAVAIVNRAFVETHFADKNPLGKRVRIQDSDEWRTIIGVVPDIQLPPLPGETSFVNATIYIPHKQGRSRVMSIVINGSGDPMSWEKPLNENLRVIAPHIALYYPPDIVSKRINNNSLIAGLKIISVGFSVFGLISLIMATAGLYAVIEFNTKSRNRELGVRMALGANKRKIIQTVIGRMFVQISIGMIAGVCLGYFLANLVKDALNFSNTNLPMFICWSMLTMVLVTSLVASLIPALRCLKMDPARVLHTE